MRQGPLTGLKIVEFAGIEGRIVNIASIASHTVLPGLSAYCGSKAAVAMLTKSFAREWARQGLAVNALCPGYIETDINASWWPTEGGQKQLKGFPRRRLMDASDLDAAFLMLAGPAARAAGGGLPADAQRARVSEFAWWRGPGFRRRDVGAADRARW